MEQWARPAKAERAKLSLFAPDRDWRWRMGPDLAPAQPRWRDNHGRPRPKKSARTIAGTGLKGKPNRIIGLSRRWFKSENRLSGELFAAGKVPVVTAISGHRTYVFTLHPCREDGYASAQPTILERVTEKAGNDWNEHDSRNFEGQRCFRTAVSLEHRFVCRRPHRRPPARKRTAAHISRAAAQVHRRRALLQRDAPTSLPQRSGLSLLSE